jgi:Thiamine pyrophosphate enzyme, N-terminal TPP binding domain/Thiamine pyrophosphate enzyme, C-terminal TPP binding domain
LLRVLRVYVGVYLCVFSKCYADEKVIFIARYAVRLCAFRVVRRALSKSAPKRGTGNMRVQSVTILASSAVQIVIGGALGLGVEALAIPRFGLSGVAVGTIATFYGGSAFLLWYLLTGQGRLTLKLRGVRLQRPLFSDILKVGALACLYSLQLVLAVLAITGLVARLGLAPLAGYSIEQRLEFLLIPVAFGNPGSTELPMLVDFPSDFRYVLGLQEAAVVAMADGYAQATHNAALVNLHSAAGVGHAMGSLFTAFKNHTPMVITAGQQARAMQLYEPYLHSSQATKLPKPYVKWSCEPARAEDVPGAIARAYYTAMMPQGPVFVSIHIDDWNKKSAAVTARQMSGKAAPDPALLTLIGDALTLCESPALVVGDALDRSGGWADVVALAERFGFAKGATPVGTALDGLDFVALAEAQGCKAIRVARADQLREMLLMALASTTPILIEVELDR